jgi:hypothetical protein
LELVSLPLPPLDNTICHTEGKKTKTEEKQVAIITVLAIMGRGVK